MSAASETVACGRESSGCGSRQLAPAPIHTSVVDALRKRWAGRVPPVRALASLEPLDEPWMNGSVHVGVGTRGRG